MKSNIARPDIPVTKNNHLYSVDASLVQFAKMYMDTPNEVIEQWKLEGRSVTEIITEYSKRELAKI